MGVNMFFPNDDVIPRKGQWYLCKCGGIMDCNIQLCWCQSLPLELTLIQIMCAANHIAKSRVVIHQIQLKQCTDF